ncbi:Endonuclease/exonuclease/phosphatase [Whalleya microplaca]|nr:Endonuclease/exonuclease/phosphatase [Whalleya microplaca]
MAFFSRIRTQFLSWAQDTPLPAGLSDAAPIFQAWHGYDPVTEQWTIINTGHTARSRNGTDEGGSSGGSKLTLVTWNVDSTSSLTESRISAILSHISKQTPTVDIIFFQEVSRLALNTLLKDSRIRNDWFSSEADETNWEGQSFASMTLLSRSRFRDTKESPGKATLGPIWRYKYPSRFGRDALCCDVFLPSLQAGPLTHELTDSRIRLVNVHLDSLPIQPSQRPRQVSIVASIIRSAGRGLVAGDFNPVLPEDDTLIQDNRLVDVWPELHNKNPGFTWGIDGKQPFPPNRLDKIAMLGLRAQDMEVMHPNSITLSNSDETHDDTKMIPSPSEDLERKNSANNNVVPWSDHSGLKCSFALVGQ